MNNSIFKYAKCVVGGLLVVVSVMAHAQTARPVPGSSITNGSSAGNMVIPVLPSDICTGSNNNCYNPGTRPLPPSSGSTPAWTKFFIGQVKCDIYYRGCFQIGGDGAIRPYNGNDYGYKTTVVPYGNNEIVSAGSFSFAFHPIFDVLNGGQPYAWEMIDVTGTPPRDDNGQS
jgi:hypothetical protein